MFHYWRILFFAVHSLFLICFIVHRYLLSLCKSVCSNLFGQSGKWETVWIHCFSTFLNTSFIPIRKLIQLKKSKAPSLKGPFVPEATNSLILVQWDEVISWISKALFQGIEVDTFASLRCKLTVPYATIEFNPLHRSEIIETLSLLMLHQQTCSKHFVL